ncbi:MAG: hypothetical protein AAGD05_12150, partial [Bacteroidota bacterium]
IQWLGEYITNAEMDGEVYQQQWQQNESLSSRVVLEQSTPRKKENLEEVFKFNLADLSERSIAMKIKDKKIYVEAAIERKQKMIAHQKDGKMENYRNKLQIYADKTDHARNIVRVLRLIVPEAKSYMKSQMIISDTTNAALDQLQAQIGSIEYDKFSIDQQLGTDCITTLEQEESGSKDQKTTNWQFNWADINPLETKIAVKGKEIFVENSIRNKQKLIRHIENEEQQNYTKSLKIRAANVENARLLTQLIPLVSTYCKKELKGQETSTDLDENLTWLKENIVNLDTKDRQYEQSFQSLDTPCKCQMTKITSTEKKSTEEIWEFNLSDIDPRAIQFKISGKSLSVEIGTRYRDKTIKAYKDGKTENYTNKISILMEEIEQARQLIKVMAQAARTCHE